MTRDEFMDIANKEVNQMLTTQKNRMMGLIERAWAEGKKNADVSEMKDIVKELARTLLVSDRLLDWDGTSSSIDSIPNACRTCSNHPSNGGSGICHCIMGMTPIT